MSTAAESEMIKSETNVIRLAVLGLAVAVAINVLSYYVGVPFFPLGLFSSLGWLLAAALTIESSRASPAFCAVVMALGMLALHLMSALK